MNNMIGNHKKFLKSFYEKFKKTFCSFKSFVKKHYTNTTGNIKLSGLSFSVFESIDFILPSLWNSINSENNIFLSTDYLKALENAPPKNMEFRYVILSEGKEPVAIAYFQILTLDANLHEPLIVKDQKSKLKLTDRVHIKLKDNISTKMLVCGNILISGEHGYGIIEGADQGKIIKGISEVVNRISRIEKSLGKVKIVVIKDFYSEKKNNKAVFNDAGYYNYFAGPNMAIPIRENWNSFEDYLSDMKSKYRRRVNGALKKGMPMIRRSLSYEEIVKSKVDLYKLYLQVADRAKVRLFVLNSDLFQEFKRLLDDKFELDAYYVNDKIIAFTTRIFNGNILEGYSHGLDYSLNKVYDIYQNILIDDIKEGIKNNIIKINFGRTSIDMKSSLGAVPEDMDFLMQFKILIPNHLIKIISSVYKPINENCRNPFI